MEKQIESVEDFLNEIVGMSAGNPVRRRDMMSLSRVAYLREIFPVVFEAGRESVKERKKRVD